MYAAITANREGHMQTILVLEDDLSNLQVYTAILSSKGYHVLEASTAEEAIQAARRHAYPIHLVVADIGLRGATSGTDAALQLAVLHRSVPVLFVTGLPVCDWPEPD